MKLLLDGNYIKIVYENDFEMKQTRVYFKRLSDNYFFNPLYKKGLWDGYISFIDKLDRIPISLWYNLKKMTDKYSIPLVFDDNIKQKIFNNEFDKDDFVNFINDFFKNTDIKPRDYQIDACLKILKSKFIRVEIPTGAGKTLIIFMIYSYLRYKNLVKDFLVIVPNTNLVTQTRKAFIDYSKNTIYSFLKNNIFEIFGGAKSYYNYLSNETGNIVIGTFHSLRNKNDDFFKKFNVICVDEAHHTNSNSIRKILNKCLKNDVYLRFGLSGTLKNNDSAESFTLDSYLGPLLFKIKADYLIKNNYIANVKVRCIFLDYLENEYKQKLKSLKESKVIDGNELLKMERDILLSNDKRFNFIIDFCSKITKNTLILFNNVSCLYGMKIHNELKNRYQNFRLYYIDGNTNVKDRDDILKKFDKINEDGSVNVLVASYGTFSTGIDIKKLFNIIFVESFKSDRIVRQSIGRGVRLSDNKNEVNIIDIIDDFSCNGYKNILYKQGEERIKIYKDQNFDLKTFKFSV